MRVGWNETSDANRFVMIGIAVLIIGIAVGTLIWTSNKFGERRAEVQSTTTTTELSLTTPPTVRNPAAGDQNTATTLINGLTRQQVENPESSVQNATQLERQFNLRSSGLTSQAYEKSVDVAERFALASATGAGQAEFAEYYKNLPNDPWVNDYELVYASTEKTSDPTVLKARVWWTGKQKKTGLTMVQVKQGFFLKRATADSLDIQPLYLRDPSNDVDYGISIVN